jgi:hypothetical protein
MREKISESEATLRRFLSLGESAAFDRPEVVAHATLSAVLHHWPSRAPVGTDALLAATSVIRLREGSRWQTQRRLAIARLARLAGSSA